MLVAAVALVVWRAHLDIVADAFRFVDWKWVVAAVLLNFASIVVRSMAWKVTVDQAVPPPHPRQRSVFAAFCVGLLGNAVLPAGSASSHA